MQRLLIQNYRYDRTASKPHPSGHDGSAQKMKTRPEDATSAKRIRNRGSRVVVAASVTISGTASVRLGGAQLDNRIRSLINAACAARAGTAQMTLNDWCDVELAVKERLKK